MSLFTDLPIKHKMTGIAMLACGVALLLSSAMFVVFDQWVLRRDLVQNLGTTAQMIGFTSASALSFDDASSAEQTLQGLSWQPHIMAACIYDRSGEVFAAYRRPDQPTAEFPAAAEPKPRFGSDRLELSRPIEASGETVGRIFIRSDLREIRARFVRYVGILGLVLVGTGFIAYLMASRLLRTISEPVSRLVAVAGRVAAENDYSVRVAKHGNDELGRLVDGFNAMLGQIQARDGALEAARANLEQRVAERTTELERENAERHRAEAALRTSEAFLQSLVETLPVHIFRKDREGRFTFANKLFAARNGRQSEEIIGKTAFDLLPLESATHQDKIERTIMATGKAYEATEEITLRDGQQSFIQLIKVPVLDADGQCLGIQGMFLDVTAGKRAEAKLAEASGLLDAMLANSPDHIYFKDRESRFVRFSNSVAQRFGNKSPEWLMGKTDNDLFTTEHAEDAYRDEQEIIRTGIPVIGKLEKETHPGGEVSWALTTKLPWRDSSGAIVGIFGISKDVTELKQVETKLAYERDQLRALLDSSPDTIYFKDAQSRFVRVSRSKVQKTLERLPDLRARRAAKGLAPDLPEAELLTGMTDFDTYQDDDAQRAFDDEQQIVRTGEPIIGKLEKQEFLDGTIHWCLTSKMPWRDGDRRVMGTFGISKDISDLKQAEEKLDEMHKQLVDASRQAGMAEVATGVLHNVGNVLNSVNVSATLVADHVRHTKATNVAKLAALFAQNKSRLAAFVTEDPRGRMIPDYLGTLAEMIAEEHRVVLIELDQLRKNIEHIKDIVAMQQAYARTSGVLETVSVPDMIEDALRINAGSLARHDVQTERDYQARPVVTTDKHKVMQILINLVRNAKYACDESGRTDKKIIVRTTLSDHGVHIAIIDNGVGIPPENLTLIFSHGFTTRKGGHGFGLHSSALAAKELGGALVVQSEGLGRGSAFTLELPYKS